MIACNSYYSPPFNKNCLSLAQNFLLPSASFSMFTNLVLITSQIWHHDGQPAQTFLLVWISLRVLNCKMEIFWHIAGCVELQSNTAKSHVAENDDEECYLYQNMQNPGSFWDGQANKAANQSFKMQYANTSNPGFGLFLPVMKCRPILQFRDKNKLLSLSSIVKTWSAGSSVIILS